MGAEDVLDESQAYLLLLFWLSFSSCSQRLKQLPKKNTTGISRLLFKVYIKSVQNLSNFLTLIIMTLIEGKVAFNFRSQDFQVKGTGIFWFLSSRAYFIYSHAHNTKKMSFVVQKKNIITNTI